MNLVSVRLITDNVAELADFYERVTAGTVVRPNDNFAEVQTANGTLAIGSTATVALFGPGSARPADNHTAIIEFLVDDVDAEFARLATWITEFVTEPTLMPWGNKSLLFRDPDGNLVNLFTPATPQAIEKFARFAR
ncbi:VOC family protein [Glaciihabitans sp. dw_435]|uniref:VOC family protein n=1 Tax=Glaciihabitans sp. dw_435 TaxID=2720081 RepID=UPI001BD2B8D2|nr:VOC family protein [Glaciihabitans sp. dw_435]